MKLLDDERNAVDLLTTPLHLGLGSRARPIDGFAFDPAVLQAYGEAVADDGIEGRLAALAVRTSPVTRPAMFRATSRPVQRLDPREKEHR